MKRLFFLLTLLLLAASAALAQNTQGTWTLYPAQSQTYQVTVQQPINPDGTSVWSANKGVVPVQFQLSTGYGPVQFSSTCGNVPLPCGYAPSTASLTFTPSSPMVLTDLTNLSTGYTFTNGDCHGGALRWSVTLDNGKSIFIYYGAAPNFTDCTTVNQTGINMLTSSDPRYDTTQLGGPFYDTWADAISLGSGHFVSSVSLVLDGGWGGIQVINPLLNPTVNDNVWQPQTGSTPTCNLPPANIQVSRLVGTPTGVIDEVAAIQQNDTGSAFRIVDCKYMYNLAAKSLGAGSYEVQVIIGTSAADGNGKFALK